MPECFHKIETVAYVRGRPITSHYSFPAGVGIEVVREIDRALVRAFGNRGSSTTATPMKLVYSAW